MQNSKENGIVLNQKIFGEVENLGLCENDNDQFFEICFLTGEADEKYVMFFPELKVVDKEGLIRKGDLVKVAGMSPFQFQALVGHFLSSLQSTPYMSILVTGEKRKTLIKEFPTKNVKFYAKNTKNAILSGIDLKSALVIKKDIENSSISINLEAF